MFTKLQSDKLFHMQFEWQMRVVNSLFYFKSLKFEQMDFEKNKE